MTCWKCSKKMAETKKYGIVEEAILILTPGKRFWMCKCGAREMSERASA